MVSPVRNPFNPSSSRYSADFEQVKTIGRGGFGSVVEAKNKLDGVRYAVKRINLKTDDTGTANKVLREVTTLATLDHPNIVRYNAAWLEFDLAVSTAAGDAGDGDSASGLDFEDVSDNSESWSDDGQGRFSAAASANVSTASNWDYLDSDASGLGGGGMSTGTNGANGGLATWNDHSGGSSIMFAHSTDHVFDHSDGGLGSAAAAAVAPSNVVATGAPPRLRPVLRLFIQMQLCERSLHDWLETKAAAKEPFALAEVASLFVQIVQGIKHVHDNGLIHRDIKPRNIFLKSAGFGEPPVVKLGDFGLAVVGDDGEPRTPRSPEFASPRSSETTDGSSGSSRHTTGVGTGTYASPEQLSNSLYNEKADIYSLGIVLFEMLSRFETEMERRTMLKDVRDGRLQPAFLQEYPQQAGLILWFTATDPADRPTATQVLESLPSQLKDGNCMVGEVGKRLAAVTEENAELISENHALKDEIALLRAQLAEARAGVA
jgi:translation initiation factor 2-alpha kinase 1